MSELHAAQAARSIVEGRYLDGHGALFPDAAQAWTEQIRSSEAIADAVVRLVELDGLPAATAGDSEAVPRRTTEFVADLVEPAKAAALDKLGEGELALGKQETGVEPTGPASCLGGRLPFEGLNESVHHVVNGGPR